MIEQDVFSAGSETTATAIEWAMSELLRNPRAMNKAQYELRKLLKGKPKVEEEDVQNLDYLKAVVKETLRLHPPAPLHTRESSERCEIGGYEFPKKTKVITNLWALGRDPESWVDAESFKPERFMQHGSESNVDFKGFDFEFIPFGTGRRICPGISFGVPMIHVALSQLLYHFDWELGNGIKPEELDMSETFGVSCRRKHDLEELACDEAELGANEFAERMQIQEKIHEQQLEMLKHMRKYPLDDQSAILEKLRQQMEIVNFEDAASVLSSEHIQEIVRRRVNLHQLAAGNPVPHHALRDLASKHGPIMHLKLGQLQAIVISSPKAAEEVLKTHELTFAQRPRVLAVEVISFGQGSIVFAPYGDYWREIRKICVLKVLKNKRVQSFGLIREEEVSNLIESISSSSKGFTPINFSEKIFSLTNGIVSRAAFGKKGKDQKEFTSLLQEAVKLAGGFGIPDLFPSIRSLGFITGTIPEMKKMKNKLGKILDSIINDHKIKTQGNEEDFVDVLLKLQESMELDLTTDQIKDVIMLVGATAIEWAMSELLRNPRAMNKAQAELRKLLNGKPKVEEADVQNLDYLKAVVKETLRLHPPAPLHARESKDPESWVDAESFKPERFMQHGSESNVDFIRVSTLSSFLLGLGEEYVRGFHLEFQ
ncbi:hypothetical protein ACLB2K_053795 [Fragaria x ananassa]